MVVNVRNNFCRVAAVGGIRRHRDKTIAMIPGVSRDVRVAAVERAARIVVNETSNSVSFVIVRVFVCAVACQTVVSADGVIVVGSIAVVVVRVRFIRLPIGGVIRAGQLIGRIVRVRRVAVRVVG